jgi:hypothetical protein
MVITIFPTALFAKQPVRKPLQAVRLSKVPNTVKTNSELKAITAHASVTSIVQEDDASVSKPIPKKIPAQVIAIRAAEPAQTNRNMKLFHLPMYNGISQQSLSNKDFVSNTTMTASAGERDQDTSVLVAGHTTGWV